MAIIKACSVETSVKNTGKECDTAMVATAMLIAIQRGLTFTDTDLEDPVAWLEGLIHERKAFPLFGQQAPIREINNNPESDILVTLDDGTQVFLRYGIYNRSFATTSGGLCYAEALASFLNSGYSIIEIDQQGQMLARKNDDGTYSGLITDFMYSPAPIMADFKNTPWKTRFQYSFSPVELVNNGIIFKGATSLLSKMGLINADFFESSAGSTTELSVGLRTECAEADLVALIGAPLADLTNVIVTNKATGAVVVPTAIAIVGGELVITGTFASAATYNVIGSSPFIWYGNDIEGYDASSTGSDGVDILIP
jgi:hypothetical protein